MIGSSAAARAEVRATLAARGVDIADVMVAPAPADPFGGDVVVVTRDEYYTGRFNWLLTPRVALEGERVPRPQGSVFEAAARAPEAQRFLTWSRFPAVDTETNADGTVTVRFSDVRYRSLDRLSGPTVRLDRALRLL
jgi:hypothetical protein